MTRRSRFGSSEPGRTTGRPALFREPPAPLPPNGGRFSQPRRIPVKLVDNVYVCTDCYFAHHYGRTLVDDQWFAGESDTPADREPLGLLADYDLADNTDSDTEDGIDEFSWASWEGCGSTL